MQSAFHRAPSRSIEHLRGGAARAKTRLDGQGPIPHARQKRFAEAHQAEDRARGNLTSDRFDEFERASAFGFPQQIIDDALYIRPIGLDHAMAERTRQQLAQPQMLRRIQTDHHPAQGGDGIRHARRALRLG